ncbi:uncharacterized protein LAJ45_05776 [Morchella importuna]|uniref:uncharacterized protein n=1 Tax=Morchella importuna TaxID=1174673 RepID=UPI001E8D2A77|nr:uncharacterized protein LAJ45_05776 [Morchella importuna]KAH8150090.1 hypothetical protein LAJ45_05776 [Morchella importuna]
MAFELQYIHPSRRVIASTTHPAPRTKRSRNIKNPSLSIPTPRRRDCTSYYRLLRSLSGKMSRIDKLAILGVRSFDNTRSETIQFTAPLTLIVGYNGSGKTTIIECLKYATTGILPPNHKQGAFIHDPKMCGEKEVLAQVKLSFNSTKDIKMVCTRSLQLSVKVNTRVQKTLEGQLLVNSNGERSTIGSKCTELDTLMPQYLGVSKAVLEYVIFCHQDESLWPMSEPAVLKKRFDEIFEALKYTKAIDNIKVLRKKQNEELGKLKILLEQYRVDKDRGEKAKRRSDELHEEIERMRVEVIQLNRMMSENSRQQQELFSKAKGFEEIIATLQAKRQEARTMESSLIERSDHLTHLEESDEDLQRMQHEYGARMKTYQDHITTKEAAHLEASRELERARDRLSIKLKEEGRIQAEHAAFENQLQEREALIREISRRHGIKGFESELDDSQIQTFMTKVSRLSRDQNLYLERIKRENGEELRSAQEVLNQITSKRSSLQQKKEYARAEIKALDQKATSLQRELEAIGVSEGHESILKSKLDDKEQRLAKAKEDYEVALYEDHTEKANARLKSVEEKLDSVTGELAKVTRQADERARLGFVKKELETRRKALDSLTIASKDKIDKFLSSDWTVDSIERELQTVLREREEEIAEARRQRDIVNQELSQVQTKINLVRDSLKKKNKEAKDCEMTVLASWTPGSEDDVIKDISGYPKAAAAIEEDLQTLRGDLKYLEYIQDYFNKALKTLQDYNACIMCKRGFHQNEVKGFDEMVRKKLGSYSRETTEENIKDAEDELRLIREAAPSYDSYIRLTKTEIPNLTEDLRKNNILKDQLIDDYNKHEKILNDCISSKSEVESLKAPISEIVKYMKEIVDYEKQVEDVSSQLKDMGGSRTVEEMQVEMQQLNEEAKTLKRLIISIASEKELSRQTISLLDNQAKEHRMKLNELNFKLQQSRALVDRIDECRDNNRKQNTVIDETDAELKKLAPELVRADAHVNNISRDGAEKENQQQRDASKLAGSDMQLRGAEQGIQNYLRRGGPDRLDRCRSQVQTLEADVKKCEEEVIRIGKEVNNLEMESKNALAIEHSIQENLRFRANKSQLEMLTEEIRELESRNTEAERDRFRADLKVLSDSHTALAMEKSTKAGEMRSKDTQLEQLIQDYATDYADAKGKYKETLAKVQTTTGASNDLSKYCAALDKAIMKYHSLKMEEINRIIEELWKSTYRGTDVDTILIRSDDTEGAKGNRSYNYRVCMVKQDAEMDMRGRCSAGQRVLASIIIRLALAECFGINCGLIALDEPTTNLDGDNIRSLARSLHEIIKTRQAQSNFQLIVITHDEDFLKEMQCQDYCDHYYRISRDERQKSIIERQSIAEVI